MTDHLKALGSLHRRNVADARPLTDVQHEALARAKRSDKGTLVRPTTAVRHVEGDRPWPGFTARTASILERRGLVTVVWDPEGDDIVLDRHGNFVAQGRMKATEAGRAELRLLVQARTETLARIGKSDADEHGHYRDGRDPLDCGEYQDPDLISPGWNRAAEEKRAVHRARDRGASKTLRRAA